MQWCFVDPRKWKLAASDNIFWYLSRFIFVNISWKDISLFGCSWACDYGVYEQMDFSSHWIVNVKNLIFILQSPFSNCIFQGLYRQTRFNVLTLVSKHHFVEIWWLQKGLLLFTYNNYRLHSNVICVGQKGAYHQLLKWKSKKKVKLVIGNGKWTTPVVKYYDKHCPTTPCTDVLTMNGCLVISSFALGIITTATSGRLSGIGFVCIYNWSCHVSEEDSP